MYNSNVSSHKFEMLLPLELFVLYLTSSLINMMDLEKYVIINHYIALLISMTNLEKIHWRMGNSPEWIHVIPTLMIMQDMLMVIERCRQKKWWS